MNGRGGLPVTGWLALLLAFAGLMIWKQAPLDPKRSAAVEETRAVRPDLQDVNARLWEDPFAAVGRVTRDKSADGSRATRTLDTICTHLRARAGKRAGRLLVVGAMVSTAPYADGEEHRRRTRYAVQSALALAQYVPENADSLGWFRWDGNTDVPFELFRRKNASVIGASQFAVVLWLSDESLSLLDVNDPQMQSTEGHPVANLLRLREQVRTSCASTGPFAEAGAFEFKVLGPASSQTLRTMAQEVKRMPALSADCPDCQPAIELYSPFATAPAKEMLSSAAPPEIDRVCRRAEDEWYCRLGQVFWRHARIRFFRTTASDDALAHTLVDELARREVRVTTDPTTATTAHHVALVSEWDTYYGRRLPAVFLRASEQERACENDASELGEATGGAQAECRVHRFSYLRGLDGEGPRPVRAESSGGDKSLTDRLFREGSTDPAEGVRQFDYLRRLAGQIEAQNDRLRALGEGEIGAIGVLGSDLYDKIAVLRALRPAFPRAVFFTTDLDARLLAAEHLDWTRNLVVASGFGLQLAPCLQKDIPPFRATYQTAAFFGSRLALFNAFPKHDRFRADRCPDRADVSVVPTPDALPQTGIDAPRLDRWLAQPRLFELGRTQAVDLSPAGGTCAGLAACDDIHPPGLVPADGWRQLLRGLAGLALLLPLFMLGAGTRSVLLRPIELAALAWTSGDAGLRLRAIVGIALVTALVAWPMVRMIHGLANPAGEPFLWTEGVSVWPSELLRVVSLLLAVSFLCHALSEGARHLPAFSGAFHIPRGIDDRNLQDRLLGRFRTSPAMEGPPMAHLWTQFGASAHWSLVLARACLWTTVFLGGGFAIFTLAGASALPARGPDAFAVDRMLVAALFTLFPVLLFCVNDLIRLCGRLFAAIAEPRDGGDWPDETLAAHADLLGMPPLRAADAPLDPKSPTLTPALRAAVLDPWIDVQFVARLSAFVGPLILLPFILLALLLVARWSLFDQWDLSLSLGSVLAAGFVIACGNAWLMQRAAARARRSALDRLDALLLASKGGTPTAYPVPAHLQAMIEAVRGLRRGAFVPFVEQPIVRAILLPFSSAGGMYLIDLFALAM